MTKAYLEPNIINWSRRADWSGAELRRRLEAHDLEPHFGLHGIYELARGFLATSHQADTQRNFEILSDLEPILGPTPDMLFAKEVDRLRTGAAVIPILDELNRASARQQVVQLASGILEPEGRDFLSRREADLKRDHPSYAANQVTQIRAGVSVGAKRPRTLEEAFQFFDSQIPGIIGQLLSVTSSEEFELHARLNEFPAIRSAVRANLYMWAIPFVSGATVSVEKNDDYRHVIEGSYAQTFVTGDDQLARTVPRLHPDIAVLTWRELSVS